MMTEKEKMLSGDLYDPYDKVLSAERLVTRQLLKKINETPENEKKLKARLFKELMPNSGRGLWIQTPFYCDYGPNIVTGENVFFNFNCVVLDPVKIIIGSRVWIGPNVQIYAATHPVDHTLRATGKQIGKEIIIGDDVWIGGNVTICPGVIIGSRSIIGAGSVVTKNIPADVMAAGNPCKLIKK